MKPYGVRRKDRGCCPGHDKHGRARGRKASTTRHNANRAAKKRARREDWEL